MESNKDENHISDDDSNSNLIIPFHESPGIRVMADILSQYSKQNATLIANLVESTSIYSELGSIANSATFASVLSEAIDTQKLLDINAMVYSPVNEILNSVNFSIRELFSSSDVIAEAIASLPSISESWQKQISSMALALDVIKPPKFVVESHLARISELSVLTQSSLAHLNWDHIGDSLQLLTPNIQNILQDNLLRLAQTHSDLFDYWGKRPSIIASLPVFVSELPTVELFNEANLLESITIQEGDFQFIEQKQHAQKEIQAETVDRLPSLLAGLNKDLVSLWEGARRSLNSDNPERARHTTVSLRELFTHVLHTLAPDAEVKNWTTNPEHYHNKRPTRKARLLYICREINHGSFTNFIEADIHSTLKFLDIFQKGTHKIIVDYQEKQLHAMLVRMEATLRFLLEIWMNGK